VEFPVLPRAHSPETALEDLHSAITDVVGIRTELAEARAELNEAKVQLGRDSRLIRDLRDKCAALERTQRPMAFTDEKWLCRKNVEVTFKTHFEGGRSVIFRRKGRELARKRGAEDNNVLSLFEVCLRQAKAKLGDE